MRRTTKELDRLIARVDAGARASPESEPDDLGIALVELLAYVGDTLSFYADRIANESYLASQDEDGALEVTFNDGTHGRHPPDADRVRVVHRHGSRYVSVEMQQGRVTLDADWNAPADA